MRKKPPLSSFLVCTYGDEREACAASPAWEQELHHALAEAKRKVRPDVRMRMPAG